MMSDNRQNNEKTLDPCVQVRIDGICTDFETAWERNERPSLESHLADVVSAARVLLFPRLLTIEVRHRRGRREEPSRLEYQKAYPALADLVERVFDALDRSSHVDDVTTDDLSEAVTAQLEAPAENESPGLSAVPGYEIVGELGRGGLGIVYEAIRKATKQRVAVKVAIHGGDVSEEVRRLFLREARVLSNLKHKRIVEFYELGAVEDRFYIVMEYVRAIDTMEYLAARSGEARYRSACAIACQVLEALSYAHRRGLVHRDIKPQNVLVTRHEARLRTKLADFGLAKYFEQAGCSSMTSTGDLRGTLAFMSPEQLCDARRAKPSADLYAVGALLYYYLSGECPLDLRRSRSLLRTLVYENPIPIDERCPGLPSGLADVVHQALCKTPADRFSSARKMHAALLPFAQRSSSEPPPQPQE